MTSSDAEPQQLRLWQIMAFIAVVAVALALGAQLGGASLCLFVSTLALVVPWVVLGWVRKKVAPGLFKTLTSVVLFCLPMVLTLGLLTFARPLGLDPGDESLPDSLIMTPAAFIAAFAALFVGPWLAAFAIWKRVRPRFEAKIMSPMRRLMACVAVFALFLTALGFPVLVFPLGSCVGLGYMLAVVISDLSKPSPTRVNLDRWPTETGYVPRADGDDPFA